MITVPDSLGLPEIIDSAEWVHATATRAFMQDDPLLDWLKLFGSRHGYVKDTESPDYIPLLDMGAFLRRKGREFESRVMELVNNRLPTPATQVAMNAADALRSEKLWETAQLMEAGVPAIYQPVLWDWVEMTYGIPDLLVRSELLPLLAANTAPYAGRPGYVVVDIKYRGFDLDAQGEAGNEAAHYKAQLAIYNAALGRLQGFEPPTAYFIGRRWKNGKERVTSCLDRLIPLSLPSQPQYRKPPRDWLAAATEAVEWVRQVRREGVDWTAVPPSDERLRPNMRHDGDSPWHAAKKVIAKAIAEPTTLYHLGVGKRRELVSAGILRWDDERLLEAACLQDSRQHHRRGMVMVNRPGGPDYYPSKVTWAREEWGTPARPEFFVDFETVSDMDDDFSRLPECGGAPLVFMIGCGHYTNQGEWTFKAFCAERLTVEEEDRIFRDWEAHMLAVGGDETSPVYHWSSAEPTQESAAAARGSHRCRANWYDFLTHVVRPSGTDEGFYVRGAWGFGLKDIGKALYSLGYIQSEWPDGPADGSAAMIGAWECYRRPGSVWDATVTDISGRSHRLFDEIVAYNETDCRVMAECIGFLRALA